MSAVPPVAVAEGPRERLCFPAVSWMALAWSAVGLGLGWSSGVLLVGVIDPTGFGSLFTSPDPTASAVLTLAMGLVGVVCAVFMMGCAGAVWSRGRPGCWSLWRWGPSSVEACWPGWAIR